MLRLMAYTFVALSLAGCAPIKSFVRHTKGQGDAATAFLAPYSGPKASIAVTDFDVRLTAVNGEIGPALRQILANALINSNRFSVVERQALSAAMPEEGKPAAVAPQSSSEETQKGKIKVPDLVVTAAITEFSPSASGGRAGIGGGGGMNSGIFGGLLGKNLNKAHMALDIRIADASSSGVLAASRIRGQAADVSGNDNNAVFGAEGLGSGLSVYANTPMENAIRICIIETVRYISEAIPADYYKH